MSKNVEIRRKKCRDIQNSGGIIMKKIIILILILLTGCSPKNKQIDIVFVENAEFAKDSDVNSCTLIKSVNGEEMSIEKSLDLFIDIDGDRLSCAALDTSEVGGHKVLFNYKKQIFEAEYTVVDKEVPKIIADEDIYLEPGEELDIEELPASTCLLYIWISSYKHLIPDSSVGAINNQV